MFKLNYLTQILIAGAFVFALPAAQAAERQLSLGDAVQLAIENDPWQRGNQLQRQALSSQSMAVDTLPDPVLSMGLLNLPTNGFAFDQEAMTQLKVGIAQQFPRGDSLAIQKRQLQQLAAKHPFMAQDRKAQIAVTVSQLWLDGYAAQQSIQLLQQDSALFEQLAQTVESQYASGQKRTRQEDVVRANVELARLQDRLTQLQSDKETAMAALSQWLAVEDMAGIVNNDVEFVLDQGDERLLSTIEASQKGAFDRQYYGQILSNHPAVQALNQTISAGQIGVELEQQKYQPQWGVNASYAMRADDQAGQSRADFFSVGVSVDLPLFTNQRQDKAVQAAKYQAESLKTEKRLLLRNMLSQLESLLSQRQRLADRLANYDASILPQMHEQAEAELTAYTSNNGDFGEVMRARIAELNSRLERILIATKKQKVNAHLQYFLVQAKPSDNQQSKLVLGEQ
ncbi:TolC family protein [Aliiglaciecola lipolytica]|uniref:TolC family protein n=1 Tax=Aliiglaciecola lipolytica TaxID=477689 RepID=UPI001C0A5878|nr:TolC family protein [Aliiglaciecola lipolytica]MBU2880290.1 TolC family protein [Aliiglaciecola lipolytica]